MSRNDDFIAQLEDYLVMFDGTTPLPDRVRNAIRAELPTARQVRPRSGLLRFFTMLSNASVPARVGLATAAIVAVVVLGAALINNDRNQGVGAEPTTAPTAPAASPSPSVAAELLTLKAAPFAPCDAADTQPATCVVPGTYRLNDWPGPDTWPETVTVDVPAGWFDWDAGPGADAVLVGGGPDARGNSGWGVLFATVGDVLRDPCDLTKGMIPATQVDTPQKLAAVMSSWPKFTATAAQPITIDGHSGLKLQLTSTGPISCSASGELWRTTTGWTYDVYPMIGSGAGMGAPGTFEIVDTGHGLLVIRTTDFAQTSPNELGGGLALDQTRHLADQTALHGILDSIRLTPKPSASP
jgi:hypothetical protein